MDREVSGEHSLFYSFDILPDTALLTIKDISRLAGRSRTSLWRDVRAGLLPSPAPRKLIRHALLRVGILIML